MKRKAWKKLVSSWWLCQESQPVSQLASDVFGSKALGCSSIVWISQQQVAAGTSLWQWPRRTDSLLHILWALSTDEGLLGSKRILGLEK